MDTVSRCEVETVYAIRIRGREGRDGGGGGGGGRSGRKVKSVTFLSVP